MSAAVGAVIGLILFLAFLVFVLFLLFHGPHIRLLPVQLAASAILAHVPVALFYHPARIHFQLRLLRITEACCWLLLFVEPFSHIVIPYTLVMFTIERLIYIRHPAGHPEKITRAAAITLVAFPWVLSAILGIINVAALTESVQVTTPNANFTNDLYCFPKWRMPTAAYVDMGVSLILGGLVPFLISVIVTITALVMWCFYKRNMSRGTDNLGEESSVRNSVIAVAVLNVVYMCMFIAEYVMGIHYRERFSNISVLGIAEGVVWICTLATVRAKFLSLFRRCCPVKLSGAPVQDQKDDTKGSNDL